MYDPGEGGDSSPPVENFALDLPLPLLRFDSFFDRVCDESPFPFSCFSEPRSSPNALLSTLLFDDGGGSVAPIDRPTPDDGPPFSSPLTVAVALVGAKSGTRDFFCNGAGESVADSQSEVMEAGVTVPGSIWAGVGGRTTVGGGGERRCRGGESLERRSLLLLRLLLVSLPLSMAVDSAGVPSAA